MPERGRAPSPSFRILDVLVSMAPVQAISMFDSSTLALRPGFLFRVLDNGSVSVVDPSAGTLDTIRNPVESSEVCVQLAILGTDFGADE